VEATTDDIQGLAGHTPTLCCGRYRTKTCWFSLLYIWHLIVTLNY